MKRIIGLLALLLLWSVTANALTYYVAIGGSDANNGTSWATAWATHTKINSTVVAGDTVLFGTGNWYNVRINVPSGGTSATDRTVYACSTFTVGSAYRTTLWGGEVVGGASWVCFDSSGSNWKWKKVYAPTASARNAWYSRTDVVTCVIEGTNVLMRPCRVLNSGEYSIYGSQLAQDTSVWMNGPGTFYYQAITDTLYIWPSTRVNPNTLTYMAAVQEVFSSRSETCDYVTIYGLNIYLGHYLIAQGTSDGGGGDNWRIEQCNLKYSSNFKYSNPAAIFHGATYGSALSSWSQFNEILNCSLWHVRGDLSGTAVTPHGGSGIALYATRETVIDGCYFDSTVFAAGVSLKMGNYPDFGHHAVGNVVRNCTCIGQREYGIWIGEKAEACSAYTNIGYKLPTTFIQLSGASATDSTGYARGGNFICNNTAYKCNALFGAQEAISGSGTVVKYNLMYDYLHASNQYDNWMRLVSWNGHQPQEFISIDSNMYFDPATSFIGYCNSNSTNWTQWQACGLDAHSTPNVDPLLTDPENRNFGRPTAPAQMNFTYGGKPHTYYGAWQPAAPSHSPKWHDIGQMWHDNYGGLVNTANGFASGDTLNFIENVYCRNKKWGLVIQTPVIILGNGYKLAPDSVALNNIANNSFETPDTDPTRAVNWDFSDAPAITRRSGHYEVVLEGSDEPSVWDGGYALRVQLPCTTQTVKSAAFYNFAPKTHHAIEMAYLNTANTNVRVTMGLLTAGGDTAYSATNNTGTMERGSEPVWVHFMTGNSVESYKIFIQITGGSTAASSDQVYFDHVLHTTFRSFGVALEPDTCSLVLDMMNAQRYHDAAGDTMAVDGGTCYGTTASNREFWGLGVAGGVGEGTIIRDLRIEPVQPSLFSVGIYGSYTCSDVTIKKATIFPKGSNPNGIFTWNAIRWNVDSTDVTFPDNPLSFHYTKREAVPSVGVNLRADKGGYGYSSVIDHCRFYNYPYQGVYVTTKRDVTGDGILQYPRNIVQNCEFYPKTVLTNGFAIEDYGNAASIIRYNKVFGTGTYHGTGIHITTKAVDPDSMQWSIVEGNIISVESYQYSQEYGYGNLAYGIQIEGAPICSLRNNYATALAINPSAPAVDGIRITRSGSFKWFIHDNTFRGFSTGTVTGSALQLYYPSWSYQAGVDFMEMRHNNFISNGLLLRGVGVNSVGLEFRDNFFDFKDTLTAPNWRKAKNGENTYLSSRDLRFIDNRYGDAEADSAFERTMMFGAYNFLTTPNDGTEWFISWTATINSRNETAAPLSGTNVEIRNALDSLVYSGVTGVSGQLITILDEFRDSAKTTTYNQNSDRALYNPYTIKVTHNFVEQQQQFTINQPTTLNFTFQSGEQPSTVLRKKKRQID